jgi:tetratricopeptide (TPR) repeat protein
MKQAATIIATLAFAAAAFAQYGQAQGQTPPPSQPAAGQQAGQQAAQPANPAAGKRMPQAKTQPEYDAFQAATATQDPAAVEKAATDFATKFPDSELRLVLFKMAMRGYQNAGNADKMLEMGRKALAIDANDPESLIDVSQVLAERTRDTDLDKDQKLDEAMKLAQHSLETIDTDLPLPPNTPQDKIDAAKSLLRSSAYSIMGTLKFNKNDFTGAEADLRKSIDAYPQQPDPVTVLRLALAIDKQNKYPEALVVANRAVELTQEGTPVGSLARKERDRLVQLTGGAAPKPAAQGQTPPKN